MAAWVSRYGVPAVVTTDRGRQFTSGLWKSLNQLLGSHHITTTSYHPEANGMVERFHRHLKAALTAQGDRSHWVDQLPLVLLGIRAAVREDTGSSVAEMLYGTSLRLPNEFFEAASRTEPDASAFVKDLGRAMRSLRSPSCRSRPATRSLLATGAGDMHTCFRASRCLASFTSADIRWPLSCPQSRGQNVQTPARRSRRHRLGRSSKARLAGGSSHKPGERKRGRDWCWQYHRAAAAGEFTGSPCCDRLPNPPHSIRSAGPPA